MNLIAKDVSRCINHDCPLHDICLRYQQYLLDSKDTRASYICPNLDNKDDCEYYLRKEEIND